MYGTRGSPFSNFLLSVEQSGTVWRERGGTVPERGSGREEKARTNKKGDGDYFLERRLGREDSNDGHYYCIVNLWAEIAQLEERKADSSQ